MLQENITKIWRLLFSICVRASEVVKTFDNWTYSFVNRESPAQKASGVR